MFPMRSGSTMLMLMLLVALATKVAGQYNHIGVQFTRVTGEAPAFFEIALFDDEYDWQTGVESALPSAELSYLKSINESLAYKLRLGYASLFYQLSTSESLLIGTPLARRTYDNRFLNSGIEAHYYLPDPFGDFHLNAGLTVYSLLQSTTQTEFLESDRIVERVIDNKENINTITALPELGINYSFGNETVLLTINASGVYKPRSFYKLLEDSSEKILGKLSITCYLNISRWQRNKATSYEII